MSMHLADEVAALLAAAGDNRWSPPSIDDVLTWGKHKGLTYREAASRDPSYFRWAASTIHALKGQLCAEALAAHLGVEQ